MYSGFCGFRGKPMENRMAIMARRWVFQKNPEDRFFSGKLAKIKWKLEPKNRSEPMAYFFGFFSGSSVLQNGRIKCFFPFLKMKVTNRHGVTWWYLRWWYHLVILKLRWWSILITWWYHLIRRWFLNGLGDITLSNGDNKRDSVISLYHMVIFKFSWWYHIIRRWFLKSLSDIINLKSVWEKI